MKRLRWYDYITINIYWLAQGMESATLTPIVLPLLVLRFVPADMKNTFYGALRAAGLVVAILVQPAFGLLSDRSTSRWGRRRPFIAAGTLLCILLLTFVGLASSYWSLFLAVLLLQFASNVSHGALQGLIPDLVPEEKRGKASGVKAIFDLLPIILTAFTVAKLADAGRIWAALLIVMAFRLVAMLVTVLCVKEEPLTESPDEPIWPLLLRVLGLLLGIALGVVVAGVAGGVVGGIGGLVAWAFAGKEVALLVGVGLAGGVAIIGAIIAGVWASVSIAAEARRYPSFTWWVVNRLLFMAAVGSIQGFALYFLQDVLKIPNAGTVTGQLMAVVGVFTLLTALPSGWLADRFGNRALLIFAGIGAAFGTLLLFLSANIIMVYVSGCIIGLSAGVFMTTNWALGTDLVPKREAGRYLGISNLAGAGAGMIGTGVGGPLADYFNRSSPGLGYMVVFAIYCACFLLSAAVISRIGEESTGTAT